MFDKFLSALEDYIDLRIETERDQEEHSGRWHEHMRERTRDITKTMHSALDAYIEERTGITLP